MRLTERTVNAALLLVVTVSLVAVEILVYARWGWTAFLLCVLAVVLTFALNFLIMARYLGSGS